jgi:adenylate kinase
MKNIILFGKPGSGKGTQANFLKENFNLVHISTGDVFRYNIKNNTFLGVSARKYMDKGDLVPDEVTIQMLEAEVSKYPNAPGFIFDGFPRTISQAIALDAFLSTKNMVINSTLALEVDENILVQRLLNRGKDSGRADDQDENKIRNRFSEYNAKTLPLINYYKSQGKFKEVDGARSIEVIADQLTTIIQQI